MLWERKCSESVFVFKQMVVCRSVSDCASEEESSACRHYVIGTGCLGATGHMQDHSLHVTECCHLTLYRTIVVDVLVAQSGINIQAHRVGRHRKWHGLIQTFAYLRVVQLQLEM
jgi:hypothetical protein